MRSLSFAKASKRMDTRVGTSSGVAWWTVREGDMANKYDLHRDSGESVVLETFKESMDLCLRLEYRSDVQRCIAPRRCLSHLTFESQS